ncbi:hypothetical protein LINPERPRIM_LOCUS34065 [Linum perenne]
MFADDTMVFIRVTRPALVHLRAMFTRYQLLSGQQINYTKSSVLFSKNVPDAKSENIRIIFKFTHH